MIRVDDDLPLPDLLPIPPFNGRHPIAAVPPSRMEEFRILIAEDNRINQRVLHRTLTRIGFKNDNIHIVGDGQLAVDAHAMATADSKSRNYDVVFMDLQMPNMDGLEGTHLIP